MGSRDVALLAAGALYLARAGAALQMRVEDYFVRARVQRRRQGPASALRSPHKLLDEYISRAGIDQQDISRADQRARGWS